MSALQCFAHERLSVGEKLSELAADKVLAMAALLGLPVRRPLRHLVGEAGGSAGVEVGAIAAVLCGRLTVGAKRMGQALYGHVAGRSVLEVERLTLGQEFLLRWGHLV